MEQQGMNRADKPRRAAGDSVPVETPDVPNLPHTLDHGVKVFHLVAEPVQRKIVPYKTVDVWGYNGSCPGPCLSPKLHCVEKPVVYDIASGYHGTM